MIFQNCFFLRNGGVGANYNNPFFPIINLGGPPVGHVMDRHFKPSFLYRKCHQPNWWLWHWQQCFFWWCNWRTNMCTCRCRLVILDDHFWEKLIVEKTWKNKNGKTNCFTKYHPKRVAGQIQPQKCIFEYRERLLKLFLKTRGKNGRKPLLNILK